MTIDQGSELKRNTGSRNFS